MFNNYLFRPSQLDKLMTNPKSKSELLSATTKSVLDEIFIREFYGREKIVVSKYMEKGTERENDSISLYRQFRQEFMVKNEEKLSNKFLTGTPDIIQSSIVVDIKTCWDIFTFFAKDPIDAKKTYYWQLVGYMMLTKKKKATLAYCLVDNDEYTIYQEVKKIQYTRGLDEIKDQEELLKIEEQIRKNNTYSDIPTSQKVKEYHFELDTEDIDELKNRIILWREYLNSLYQKHSQVVEVKIKKTRKTREKAQTTALLPA